MCECVLNIVCLHGNVPRVCVSVCVLNVGCVLVFVLCITYMYINIYACNVRVFTWLSVCLCLIGARGDGMTLFNLQQTSSSRNL